MKRRHPLPQSITPVAELPTVQPSVLGLYNVVRAAARDYSMRWRCHACRGFFSEDAGRITVGDQSWCVECVNRGLAPGVNIVVRDLSNEELFEIERTRR
jgi:hypothetical protein